jgi:hypothetical protein
MSRHVTVQLWQLEALLLQRDEYMAYSRQLSSGSATQRSQTLGNVSGPSQQKRRRRWSPRHAAARARVAASEGWQRAWVLALWFAAMAALFAWKFAEYRWRSPAFAVTGYCLPTAKGAAETLKLNMALVLLPVCRNTLTWLRSSWARYFVPFDDSIAFHKVTKTTAPRCGTHHCIGAMHGRSVRRSPSVARRSRLPSPSCRGGTTRRAAAWRRGRVVVKLTVPVHSDTSWCQSTWDVISLVEQISLGPNR